MVKYQFKFHFGYEKRSVCYIIYVLSTIHASIFWEMIFHGSNSECCICEALLSPLVRKILSAIVLPLVKFLEGERHESIQREKEVWKLFFSASNTGAEEVHFWRGWRYSSSISFYLYWLIKIWVSKMVLFFLLFPLIFELLHHCSQLLVVIYT